MYLVDTYLPKYIQFVLVPSTCIMYDSQIDYMCFTGWQIIYIYIAIGDCIQLLGCGLVALTITLALFIDTSEIQLT